MNKAIILIGLILLVGCSIKDDSELSMWSKTNKTFRPMNNSEYENTSRIFEDDFNTSQLFRGTNTQIINNDIIYIKVDRNCQRVYCEEKYYVFCFKCKPTKG